MTREAHCCRRACGIEVGGQPLNAIDRCNNAERRTGSAFGRSACFADKRVTARTGHSGFYEIEGANRQRRWSGACGTTVPWRAEGWPSRTGIAGGCFGETPLPAPSVTNDGTWLGLPPDWRTSL